VADALRLTAQRLWDADVLFGRTAVSATALRIALQNALPPTGYVIGQSVNPDAGITVLLSLPGCRFRWLKQPYSQ
jgi:hypothetical protein